MAGMRIQTRILSAVILVVVIINIVYGVYVIKRERQQEIVQLHSTMEENDKLLKVVTASPLYDGNMEQLNAIFDSVFADHDIVRIELTEYNGDIEIRRTRAPINTRGESVERRTVIMWGIDELGEIQTTYSTARIEQLFITSARSLSFFALVMILMLSGVIYLVARGISSPIERLTVSAEDMASGHLDREINTSGVRELQSLAQSFIRMRDAIQEKMADLAAQNAALLRTQFSIDRAKDAIFWVRPDGYFAYVNEAACTSLGYSREELLSLAVFDIDPLYPKERWLAHWEETRKQGFSTIETTQCARDGRIFPVELSVDFMSFAGEEYLCTFARDITERKKAEERIIHLNRVYVLLSNVNEAIVRIRERQVLLDEICRISVDDGRFQLAWIGLTDEEGQKVQVAAKYGSMGDYLDNLNISLTEVPEGQGPIETAIRSGKPSICNDIEQEECSAPWRDQALGQGYHAMASFPLTVFGRIVGALNIYSVEKGFFKDPEIRLLKELSADISFAFEFMESEEEQQKLTSVIEASADLIGMADLEGNLLYLNTAGMNLIGLDERDEVRKTIIRRFLFEEDYHKFETEIMPSIMQRGSWFGDIVYRHFKTGASIPVDMTAFVIKDEKTGQPMALAYISRDITDRKRAEEERLQLEAQLMQAQKMESVGRLAGGVAHDTNNMLSVILGYADLLKHQLPEGDPSLRDVEEIQKAAIRSRDITRQLLAFSRQQIIAPKTLNLNDLVSDTQKVLTRLIGEDIDLRFYPSEDLWLVKLDPSQVDQILMNFAVNARDAMPNGGKLTIETANVNIDESYCRDHAGLIPGDFVQLTVSDNGEGMDEEILSHVFEPFFTTKDLGKGTGLGLATVYGIVKQNKGFINVYSEPGQGTTFRVYFPKIFVKEAEITEKGEETQVASGTGTILLVEDDEMVRSVAFSLLQKIGYTVLSEKTPMEALSLLEKTDTPVDLLLTDVVMPEMKGNELRDKARVVRPGIKVLFMSGYTTNVIAHHGVLENGVNFIEKPFSMESLAQKVRKAMKG